LSETKSAGRPVRPMTKSDTLRLKRETMKRTDVPTPVKEDLQAFLDLQREAPDLQKIAGPGRSRTMKPNQTKEEN